MFRQIVAVMTVLLALTAAASADSTLYTYSDLAASNVYYECEDFTDDLPGELQTALAGRLWANDRILCGAMRSAYLRSDPDRAPQINALIAVERQGALLLFGASNEDGEWSACLETDGFLSAAQDFEIAVLANYSIDGGISDASLALIVNEEEFRVVVRPNGCIELDTYRYEDGSGSAFELRFWDGSLNAAIAQNGIRVQEASADGLIPRRLCAWTYAGIPANMAQLRAFAQLNPAILKEGEAVIYGVNFREEPTTKARSMGIYTAKARLLGRQSGDQSPWYNVVVGDTEGWVSGTYVVTADMPERRGQIEGNLSEVLAVARADDEIHVQREPGGSSAQIVPEGTLMHVVSQSDGWLHVLIPRGEITWKTDWDGTYGFVQESSVTTGLSIADVKWKE